MTLSKGVSKTAQLATKAREAVGKHLNVQWTDAEVPSGKDTSPGQKEAIKAALEGVSVCKNGSPSLIFVFTDRNKPQSKAAEKNKIPPEPTAQAKSSAAAWTDLFQTPGDFSIFIPGKFFNVVRMNATSVDESMNKFISSEKAPMVVLTSKSGEVVSVFEGKAKIKTSSIVNSMIDLLKRDGMVKGAAPFAELNALMVNLEKTELSTIYAEEALSKAKAALSKEESEESARQAAKARKKQSDGKERETPRVIVMAKKNVDAAEATVKSRQKEKNELLRKEYAMLKKMELASDKMPPAPSEESQ